MSELAGVQELACLACPRDFRALRSQVKQSDQGNLDGAKSVEDSGGGGGAAVEEPLRAGTLVQESGGKAHNCYSQDTGCLEALASRQIHHQARMTVASQCHDLNCAHCRPCSLAVFVSLFFSPVVVAYRSCNATIAGAGASDGWSHSSMKAHDGYSCAAQNKTAPPAVACHRKRVTLQR